MCSSSSESGSTIRLARARIRLLGCATVGARDAGSWGTWRSQRRVRRPPGRGGAVRGAQLSPAGNPQILVIEGEPGIGKTAFVHQFLSRASGVTVLEASGEETEAAPDYGVVGQRLARATPGASSEALNEQLSAASLASRFAVGAELADDARIPPGSGAGRIGGSVAVRRSDACRRIASCSLIVTRADGVGALGPAC